MIDNIFNENIQFARTKCQPLIPHQSVIQPNSFKSECKKFKAWKEQKAGQNQKSKAKQYLQTHENVTESDSQESESQETQSESGNEQMERQKELDAWANEPL